MQRLTGFSFVKAAQPRAGRVVPSPLLTALRIALIAALLFIPIRVPAQGCAQCRDNTAATPPATQAAYRHAIALLVIAGGSIFVASVLLLRRQGDK